MSLFNVEDSLKLFGLNSNRRGSKIAWWVPYWFHIPRTWRVWRLLLLSRSIVRASIVAVIVGAAIVIGLKIAIPMIQLPPLWKMLSALPVFYAYVLIMWLVHTLIPSRVDIRKDRIHAVTGQSQWMVKSDAVRGARIVVFAPDRIRLRIFYQRKDQLRSRTFGVGRRVSLDRLSAMFATPPQVWDARHRYAGSRRAIG
jgi:hypothetical protein